ncbi:hypothetical protein DRP53_01125 [candidate division WOR-3 bacterium]|uniref:Uncharacterized protein n=1 Tax=candidate division WOR-3 bacterium TaxID=2052148 RepID=A0A660SLA4_UNCW3|nr:MAG: hypothetical protein DRP53_01125 [candidate division WOR-3 bacterium]
MIWIILIAAEFQICGANGNQYNRDIAFDGTNFLTIWRDHRVSSVVYHLYGARVTPQGQVLDPNGRRYASQYDTVMNPTVASGGGTYLIAFRDHC